MYKHIEKPLVEYSNRFNIQQLEENGWFTYKYTYEVLLEELILYVENWMTYHPQHKFRIIDYKTGKVVYV